ncbi:hypothetical protein IQ07DRAFT_660303 [Pyrenochaeta sp. DS3sAY3a]|nr:hypothetical protein IQ07DRAFT_660303 [Pyrenochaeta sp. DS3sAY3a]
MAAETYVRDIAQYFQSGVATDLTLIFGDRTRQLHKALVCCHSKWFQKAVNGRFEEATSGVITLMDNDQFLDAIDCMVTYFYQADYVTTALSKDAALFHAQVVIIANKYDCESLSSLAYTYFTNSVKEMDSKGWVDAASLIYNHATTDLQIHKDLRSWVTSSIPKFVDWQKVLRMEKMIELLHLNKDLAIDLLRDGMIPRKRPDHAQATYKCRHCRYMHIGSSSCAITRESRFGDLPYCTQCDQVATDMFKDIEDVYPCPDCDDGLHNRHP